MTAFLLATLLNLAPGIQLVDNVEARHVVLSDVRLKPIFVADEEKSATPVFETMGRDELYAQLKRLEDSRPGLGGPIAALAIGVALVLPGAGITVAGAVSLIAGLRGVTGMAALTTAGIVLLSLGVVMVVVGAILCTVGGIKLGSHIRERTLNGREADEVRRRIDALGPLQPQPVPMSRLQTPEVLQTVLTF